VCILRLKLFEHSLCLILVHGSNSPAVYQEFASEISDALRWVITNDFNESTILLEDLNAHARNAPRVWKGVNGRHGDADVNDNRRLMLQLCFNNALCIMNTFFQDRDLQKYIWCRHSLRQRSLIDFCIVSADLI